MPTAFYQLRPKLKLVVSVLKRLLTISASFPPLMFTLKKSYETIKFEGRFDWARTAQRRTPRDVPNFFSGPKIPEFSRIPNWSFRDSVLGKGWVAPP